MVSQVLCLALVEAENPAVAGDVALPDCAFNLFHI
jgi:hypothetical protein